MTRDNVDYRIVKFASYPSPVYVSALVVTASEPDGDMLRKISTYAEVKKAFPFLMAVKIRGTAGDIVRLGNEKFVKYIALEEVIGES